MKNHMREKNSTTNMTGATMIPLLKDKVDELFLHWFSEVETQTELRKELAQIRARTINEDSDTYIKIPPPLVLNSTQSTTTTQGLANTGLNARPSSPPVPPGSPTTPRSPRRRTNSDLSRRGSRKSTRQKQNLDDEKPRRPQIYPGCAENMKQFYFPFGEPKPIRNEGLISENIKAYFQGLKNGVATIDEFKGLMEVCGLPLYWKFPYFNACGGTKTQTVTCKKFIATWTKINSKYFDEHAQFFHLLAKDSRNYLVYDDFEGLLQDIINTHPGLQFLLDAPEFHTRYIMTVVARIFYTINRSWSGRLTLHELQRSNFLEVIKRLEEEEDINQILDYFSYEHFYVIYCKFWELDCDHDMVISKNDLMRYGNGALTSFMVDRLFSGCVTKESNFKEGKMLYIDFVWFILSEIDKSTPTGIEYWFRCMDIDGDGVISMYEMEQFYEAQLTKMKDIGMETLAFKDCLCQMLDLVKPATPHYVTLRDLKNCKLAAVFFDTFFNLEKWLEHEQKDPFLGTRNENGEQELSTWDRYVAEEYELLVAEEGGNQEIDYDDDFFDNDDTSESINVEELLKPLNSSVTDSSYRWSSFSAPS